jgi:beta-ribofuranosylaminobenzene 5'-phosphate synthase
MKTKIQIRSYPRIHITLIDLVGVTHRRYGGAGFALNAFPAEVQAEFSKDTRVQFECELPTLDREVIQTVVDRLSTQLNACFLVRVSRMPPQHAGFGSKTAVLLGVCTACNSLLGGPLSQEQLQTASGRGGTSGLGVNLFFHGGFLVDLGHPSRGNVPFVPSSAQCPVSVPPVSVRLPFPEEWSVHLLRPFGKQYFGSQESEFFAEHTPIPPVDALEILAAVYHGVVPAIRSHDLNLLKDVLSEIHARGFKHKEVAGQPLCVAEVIEALKDHKEVAVGMSSMGPLVYAVAPSESRHLAAFGHDWQNTGAGEYLGAYMGRNDGYQSLGVGHG